MDGRGSEEDSLRIVKVDGVSRSLWCGRSLWCTKTSLEAIEIIDRPVGLVGVLILKFGDPDDICDCADYCSCWNNPPNQGGKGNVIAAVIKKIIDIIQ